MAKSEGQVLTLTENCIGCELCYSVYPFDAVSFEANSYACQRAGKAVTHYSHE